jgi:hypothetical protein
MLRALDKYDGYDINGKKIRLIDVCLCVGGVASECIMGGVVFGVR